VTKKDVLILGAGFAGLELSTRLSASMGDEVQVTLIDAGDSFVFGFSKLDILFGHKTRDDVRLYYRDIAKKGVEFRRERVTSIDPANRRVTTDANTYEPDVLVVALGAEYEPDATPGFVEDGHEFYSIEGAERLRDALAGFREGSIVIAILKPPFKCPPAPFEAAFLLHDHLTAAGVRDRVEIRMFSPMPSPIPVSAETSEAIVAGLGERGIEIEFGRRVTGIDPSGKTAELDDGRRIPYDLFVGIPKHRVPQVVEASGLTAGGADGWVHVDPRNLRTPFDGVYALGDCADAPVPRAGVFAESAARAVADDIAARLHGGELTSPFDGRGSCYIEFGGGLVGKVDADFLSGPAPIAPFIPPSEAIAREKAEFAASRKLRWFR
jgi:sulfide:quinone oxidoreductase